MRYHNRVTKGGIPRRLVLALTQSPYPDGRVYVVHNVDYAIAHGKDDLAGRQRKDKLNRPVASDIPAYVHIQAAHVIDADVYQGRVEFVRFRVPTDNPKLDLILGGIPSDGGGLYLLSAWFNLREDQHTTVNRDLYEADQSAYLRFWSKVPSPLLTAAEAQAEIQRHTSAHNRRKEGGR